jgi:hypothetical protein
MAAGPAAAVTIYYDNTNPAQDALNDLVFSFGPYTGIGDSIVLTSAGNATNAAVQFYNDGSAGTFDASLLFFAAGSPVGTLIGSKYTLPGLSIGAGSELDANFQLGFLSVPQDLVFLLEVANVSAGVDPGVELYADPTNAGSNTADSAVFLQGIGDYSQQSTVDSGGGNPYFQLYQTPEPSTFFLMGSGLLAAAAWRKRRRS